MKPREMQESDSEAVKPRMEISPGFVASCLAMQKLSADHANEREFQRRFQKNFGFHRVAPSSVK